MPFSVELLRGVGLRRIIRKKMAQEKYYASTIASEDVLSQFG
jgi:hypothetical protein